MPVDQLRMGSYRLGAYESKVSDRLTQWREQQIGRRIWEKDFTVWSPTEIPEIMDRLGWLELPESMNAEIASIRALADEVKAQAIKHVVLLGTGGSSLAPEVYKRTFGSAPECPELIVLDSTHPSQVRMVESMIDLEKTYFIVASKSGTTLEPLSLFEYFYRQVSEVTQEPGGHFIAITDQGTPLHELAKQHRFRRIVSAIPDVGGRYSALSHFGLVPAALIGIDVGRFLSRAKSMAVSCALVAPEDDNPGLVLGAALGELALAGHDKVTLVTSPSISAFPQWLEQLIAESTGKDSKGIVPVVDEMLAAPDLYGSDRFFVYIAVAGEADEDTEARMRALEAAGHPVARFILKDRSDLAAEMFRWELAVASAGAALGINPFDQPDVQTAKDLAREAIAGKMKEQDRDTGTISIESPDEIARGLDGLLDKAKPGAYFGIHAYLEVKPRIREHLQAIRHKIRDRFKLATTVGFGPRFLHSTGQLHKGGPKTGVFLQLVDEPAEDLAVPDTDYTFGKLIAAQALGDYEALRRRDRRVLRVQLGKDSERALGILQVSLK